MEKKWLTHEWEKAKGGFIEFDEVFLKNYMFGNSLVPAQTSATINQNLLRAKNYENEKKNRFENIRDFFCLVANPLGDVVVKNL